MTDVRSAEPRGSVRRFCYNDEVSKRVSNEELEAVMAAYIDEDGVDKSVVELTKQMTPEQRAKSDENIRRWAERVQATIKKNRERTA